VPTRLTRAVALATVLVAAGTADIACKPTRYESRGDVGTQTSDTAFDVVIRGGRVLDGTGNPWIGADVAIRDGRFVRIGQIKERGRVEIDARGKYVSPGWIDMMDQSGGALLQNGRAETKLQEGVTTAIAGEDSPPVHIDSLAAYFRRLERQGISVNFGTYVSEVQMRVALLGQSARDPTAAELDSMRTLMAVAMKQGALGMTTALIYPPMSYTKTPELIALAKVAGQYGGIYASHIRGEGKEVLDAIREAIQIGREGHLPVEVYHLKVAYAPAWGVLMPKVGALIDSARQAGLEVSADMYVYTAGGTGLDAVIPAWAHEGGDDSLRARLANPKVRARLTREVLTGSPGWWNIVETAGGWDHIMLADARNPANARFDGQSITAIARAWHKTPTDAAFDLVAQGHGRTTALYFMMSEGDIETALRFPWTSIGSDAGAAVHPGALDTLDLPHPRAYGNFPRVIAHYVRERHTLTLPEAIRKMTSWPASRMRLADRGVIKEGTWADVTVFDYDSLEDRATYAHPYLAPSGIDYVLVNGTVVIDHGKHTGTRPGKVLWGPGTVRDARIASKG
jgi:N-acyl-D-amino-acid deacylase